MQETWVQSLGWEDPLEKGKATHSSSLAWRIPWTVHGIAKSRTRLSDFHFPLTSHFGAALVAQPVKRLPAMWETWVSSLSREDLLEEEMATHSSILAWRIPWMEEPARLQSMGSQRVGWLSNVTFHLPSLRVSAEQTHRSCLLDPTRLCDRLTVPLEFLLLRLCNVVSNREIYQSHVSLLCRISDDPLR